MSYFQGGDYVELFSAQGKAPASTWKLQGKIIKSFDKAIKGNAFQMDGSSETKMQLPKKVNASSSSLGLTQRFLILQLLVPHTRSFSVEIGFSDFQKIRRRLVFASAFREMTMTTLHVQIPIGSSVPRDQWMNFVFDLQALTEHCFPASSYRSVESICISGSCRLKRIFTMKDAPFCEAVQNQLQAQLLQFKQHRLQSKDPGSVPITVAGVAEMKEIPKQFVFSVAPSCLPIPTEYFLISSSERDANVPSANAVVSTPAGLLSKAVPSAKAAKSGAKRATTIAENHKPRSAVPGAGGRSATSGKVAVERHGANEARPLSTPASRVPPRQEEEMRVPIVRDNHELGSRYSSPSADQSFTPAPFSSRPTSESSDSQTSNRSSPPASPQPPFHQTRFDSNKEDSANVIRDEVVPSESHSWVQQSSAFEDRSERQDGRDATAASKRKQHRQHVLSEIQSKLDALTSEAEDEEERNRALFVSRTSLGSDFHVSQPEQEHRKQPTVSQTPSQTLETFALQIKAKSIQLSADDDWHQSEMLRSPEPMVLRRACAAKTKPDITFSSSIFSFHRSESSPAALPDQELTDESISKTKKLFDWDSLLEDSVGSLSGSRKTTARESSGSSKEQTPQPAQVEMNENSPALFVKSTINLMASDKTLSMEGRGTRPVSQPVVNNEDGDVVRILNDKRSHLQGAALQLADEEPTEALASESRWERIDAAQRLVQERYDLLQSSFDFSLSPAKLRPDSPNNDCADMRQQQQDDRSVSSEAGSEGSVSLDLTDQVQDLELQCGSAASPTELKNDSSCGPPSDDLDEEDSFDFDDLVVRDRECSPLTRRSQQFHTVKVERTAKATPDREQPKCTRPESSSSVGHIATNGTRERVKDTSSSKASAVAKLASPLPKPATKLRDPSTPLGRARSSSRAMSSSDRRLASLLESTDWSQLPLSSTVASPVPVFEQPTKPSSTTVPSRDRTKNPLSSSSSLELIYDPILRCYYDPVGKKYYTLAK